VKPYLIISVNSLLLCEGCKYKLLGRFVGLDLEGDVLRTGPQKHLGSVKAFLRWEVLTGIFRVMQRGVICTVSIPFGSPAPAMTSESMSGSPEVLLERLL